MGTTNNNILSETEARLETKESLLATNAIESQFNSAVSNIEKKLTEEVKKLKISQEEKEALSWLVADIKDENTALKQGSIEAINKLLVDDKLPKKVKEQIAWLYGYATEIDQLESSYKEELWSLVTWISDEIVDLFSKFPSKHSAAISWAFDRVKTSTDVENEISVTSQKTLAEQRAKDILQYQESIKMNQVALRDATTENERKKIQTNIDDALAKLEPLVTNQNGNIDKVKSDTYKQSIEALKDPVSQMTTLRAFDEYNKTLADKALKTENQKFINSKNGVWKSARDLRAQKSQEIAQIKIDKKTEKKLSSLDKAKRLLDKIAKDFDPLKKENETIAFADLLWDINFDGKLDENDSGVINGKQIAYAFTDAYEAWNPVTKNIVETMLTANCTDSQKTALEDIKNSALAEGENIKALFAVIQKDPSLLLLFSDTLKAVRINAIDLSKWFNYGQVEASKLSETERRAMKEGAFKNLKESFEKQTGKNFLEYIWNKTTFLAAFFDGLKWIGINESLLFNMIKTNTFNSNLAVSFGGFGNWDLNTITPFMDISVNAEQKISNSINVRANAGVSWGLDVSTNGARFMLPMPHASIWADFKIQKSSKNSLDARKQTAREISPTFYWTPIALWGEVELSIAGDRIEGIENQTDIIVDKISKALAEVAKQSAEKTNTKTMVELLKEKFPKTSKETIEKQAKLLEQVVEVAKKSSTNRQIDANLLAKKFSEDWRNEAIMSLSQAWKIKSVAPGVVLVAWFMPAATLRATFTKITDKYYTESTISRLQKESAIQTGAWIKEYDGIIGTARIEKLQKESPDYISVINNGDNTMTVKLSPEVNKDKLHLLDVGRVYVADAVKDYIKIDEKTWDVTLPTNIDVTLQRTYWGDKVRKEARKWFMNKLLGKTKKVTESGEVEYALVIWTNAANQATQVEKGDASYIGSQIDFQKNIEWVVTASSLDMLVQQKSAGKLENVRTSLDGINATISFDVPNGYDIISTIGNKSSDGKAFSLSTQVNKEIRILKDATNKRIYIQSSDAKIFGFGLAEKDLTTKDVFPDLEKPTLQKDALSPREIVNNRYSKPKEYNAFIKAMKADLSNQENINRAIAKVKELFPALKAQPLNRADVYMINGLLATVASTENKGYSKDNKFDKTKYDAELRNLDPQDLAKAPKNQAEMLSLVSRSRSWKDKIAMASLMKMPLGMLINYREKADKGIWFQGYASRMAKEWYSQDAINLYKNTRSTVGKKMMDDIGYGRTTIENGVAIVFGYDRNGTLDEKLTTHPEVATKQKDGATTYEKFDRNQPATKEIIKKFFNTLKIKSPDLIAQFTKVVNDKMTKMGLPLTTEDKVIASLINDDRINGIPVRADFGFAFYANCFNESIVMQWLQVGDVDVKGEWVQTESVLWIGSGVVENKAFAESKDVSVALLSNWYRKGGKWSSTTDKNNDS